MSDPFPTYRIMESKRSVYLREGNLWHVTRVSRKSFWYQTGLGNVLSGLCHCPETKLPDIQTGLYRGLQYRGFTIASACNKVLRKKFLKPRTIGLIPDCEYSCNNKYSKKALMWLLHMEHTGGCRIIHARNGREYRPPEIPNYSVDVYCPETIIIYEFFVVFIMGIPVNRFEISKRWVAIH